MFTLHPYVPQATLINSFSWAFRNRDFVDNLIVTFPFGFFTILGFRNINAKTIVKTVVASFVLSFAVEIAQLFLRGRTSQYFDVIGNTIGYACGTILAVTLKTFGRRIEPLDRRAEEAIALAVLIIILTMQRSAYLQEKIDFSLLTLMLSGSVIASTISIYSSKHLDRLSLVMKSYSVSSLLLAAQTSLLIAREPTKIFISIAICPLFSCLIVYLSTQITNPRKRSRKLGYVMIAASFCVLLDLPGELIFETNNENDVEGTLIHMIRSSYSAAFIAQLVTLLAFFIHSIRFLSISGNPPRRRP